MTFKNKTIFYACLFTVVFLTGCVGMSQINEGVNAVNDAWKQENTNLLKTAGTRTYDISKKEGFDAMVMALSDLGFMLEEAIYETGLIFGVAPAPTPLTEEEWAEAKKIDQASMQAIAAPVVGSATASLFRMDGSGDGVAINVHLLERKDDLQVSIRLFLDHKESDKGLGGKQIPPTQLKLGLAKTWDAYERSLFIQGVTFK